MSKEILKRYEILLDEGTIWRLRELAAIRKLLGGRVLARVILQTYAEEALKEVRNMEYGRH